MGVFTAGTTFLWLFTAVTSSRAKDLVELTATASQTGSCHSSVTLHCNISPKEGLKIREFSWVRDTGVNPEMCRVRNDNERIQCSNTSQMHLALTFKHLMPTDQGTYYCRMQSNMGLKATKSTVTVKDCYKRAETQSSVSKVDCHFYGVYPLGEVHWFSKEKNVTDKAKENSSMDQEGFYKVSSSLPSEGRAEEYNCSLWIPGTGAYLTSMLVRSGATSLQTVGVGWVLLLGTIFTV
ncbi:hypothetical protein AGOR_G00097710 [Albula goreensis]|uniref:Ig-like domain-containing protein n=1 Tax=Albula goreensis TaxID=1534307 RepID=A0A8T3DKV4_9TELE|nr:hypothetical protein AGOR_G00097710 [Albula goreensis]